MYTRLRKALDNRQDKGFTLIELLVVIIIIGILAAIAIPIFLHQRQKAVDASEKSDLRTIATNMETAFTDTQTYPGSITTVAGSNPIELNVGSEKVALSPGNTAKVYSNATVTSGVTGSNATKYCIEVSNANASKTLVWMSDNGGLQPITVNTCGGAGGSYPATVL